MNYMVRDSSDPTFQKLFRSTGVDGVYGRSALFEQIIDGLTSFITQKREPNTEPLRFPPIINRAFIEKSGYLNSFPNFLGAVCCLHGNEAQIRTAVNRPAKDGGWTASLTPTDVVLTPAACYHIYPLVAARGSVASGGVQFDVACDCFRHEPSKNADRLQTFRMREYVFIGQPEQAVQFRDRWIECGKEMAQVLGLSHNIAPASDPFFGRVGKLMADSQVEQALKFELLVPIRLGEPPTACMSFNYHQDHFGSKWGLKGEAGETIHTACTAFGMDRLALAMFAAHGADLQRWPKSVREALSI
jgi:seryl-tRNA synthetase